MDTPTPSLLPTPDATPRQMYFWLVCQLATVADLVRADLRSTTPEGLAARVRDMRASLECFAACFEELSERIERKKEHETSEVAR